MDLGLKGKVAMVTGSSDGIGYATAHALAQEGARIVICARREPLLVEAKERIVKRPGVKCSRCHATCNSSPMFSDWCGTVQRFGAIHILVNNAGGVPSIQFTDVDDAEWHQMLERKLLNYIRVTREIVPHMRKLGWGRIINIAGSAGRQPSSSGMAVGLNNAAVINWTKSLSLLYAPDGILVTAIAPGSIETPRQVRNRQREAEIRGVDFEELRKTRARDIPLQRLGRPQEVASVVVFLASEQSSYMTGSCVMVDGGATRGI